MNKIISVIQELLKLESNGVKVFITKDGENHINKELTLEVEFNGKNYGKIAK